MAGINSIAHMAAHDAVRVIPTNGESASNLGAALADQHHDVSSAPVESSSKTDPDPSKGRSFDEYS